MDKNVKRKKKTKIRGRRVARQKQRGKKKQRDEEIKRQREHEQYSAGAEEGKKKTKGFIKKYCYQNAFLKKRHQAKQKK